MSQGMHKHPSPSSHEHEFKGRSGGDLTSDRILGPPNPHWREWICLADDDGSVVASPAQQLCNGVNRDGLPR